MFVATSAPSTRLSQYLDVLALRLEECLVNHPNHHESAISQCPFSPGLYLEFHFQWQSSSTPSTRQRDVLAPVPIGYNKFISPLIMRLLLASLDRPIENHRSPIFCDVQFKTFPGVWG